jgi:hypothetical protein
MRLLKSRRRNFSTAISPAGDGTGEDPRGRSATSIDASFCIVTFISADYVSCLESPLPAVNQHQGQQGNSKYDLPSKCRDIQRRQNALQLHQ